METAQPRNAKRRDEEYLCILFIFYEFITVVLGLDVSRGRGQQTAAKINNILIIINRRMLGTFKTANEAIDAYLQSVDVGDIIKKHSIRAPNSNAPLREEVRSGQKYKY